MQLNKHIHKMTASCKRAMKETKHWEYKHLVLPFPPFTPRADLSVNRDSLSHIPDSCTN